MEKGSLSALSYVVRIGYSFMKKRLFQYRRNYILCFLFFSLLFLVIFLTHVIGSKQVITEYSSEYVALAELPSQLSFTYYGEKEWEGKLKEFLHAKNLDGKLTYGKLKSLLEQLSVQEYITYEDAFF